jgi:hypothetical protein
MYVQLAAGSLQCGPLGAKPEYGSENKTPYVLEQPGLIIVGFWGKDSETLLNSESLPRLRQL